MKKLLLLITVFVVLGFFLRLHNLTTWPREGATFDEYAWTWQGMNIIQKGVPISWSPLPPYANFEQIVYREAHFRVVTPFLEHPPLFGLVAGISAISFGAQDMYEVTLANVRPLAIFLGILSIIMVILLTYELFGKKTAFFSGILYATIPTVVVGSRLTQNENFFIPVWLFSLYCIARFFKTKKNLWKIMGIFFATILILAKIPWGAAIFSLLFIFLLNKKYKEALFSFGCAIAALLAIFLYGSYYDQRLFVNLFLFQSARYDLTFDSILALFQKPYLVDRYYTDGWIYFGWLTIPLLFLGSDVKKRIYIVAPLISYFIIFMAGIPDEAGHGWYRYPFYPFLVISLALFITSYLGKNIFLTFMFFAIVGSSLLQNTFGYVLGFSYVIYRASILSWMIPLSAFFVNVPWYKRLGNVTIIFWFCLFIILNILSIILYNEQ